MPSIWPPLTNATAGSVIVSSDSSTVTSFAFTNQRGAGPTHAPGGFVTKTDEVNMEELDSLPFNTPIETLLNLWIARFGNDWVDVNDVLAEEFYGLTYKRLKAMGQLETHYLTNKSKFVCRKPI